MTTGYASNGPVFSIWVDGVEVNGIYLQEMMQKNLLIFGVKKGTMKWW